MTISIRDVRVILPMPDQMNRLVIMTRTSLIEIVIGLSPVLLFSCVLPPVCSRPGPRPSDNEEDSPIPRLTDVRQPATNRLLPLYGDAVHWETSDQPIRWLAVLQRYH